MGNINTSLSKIDAKYLMAVSIDCVIFGYGEGKLKVLLIKSGIEPFIGKYALIGDLVRQDEDPDAAAARVLKERTGIEDLYLEQVKAFGEPDRHPLGRVITIAYYSLVKIDQITRSIDKLPSDAKWFEVNEEIPELAFDHRFILLECYNRLKKQLREKPIGFSLLPKKFTLNQLQSLYETVLDLELDKRNFRRKLKSMDLLIDLNETQQDVAHRPAGLYSFNEKLFEEKNQKGLHFVI